MAIYLGIAAQFEAAREIEYGRYLSTPPRLAYAKSVFRIAAYPS
jgi:hypothetical protein